MPLTLDAEALNASAGTWFGLASNGQSAPIDEQYGALPFDTYELEELPCPANALFQMIRDEVVIDETDDSLVVDLGTLNNTAVGKPSIRTSAYDGASQDPYDNEISANEAATIIDRVTYTGLTPGESYTLEAVLMDKATGEPFLVEGDPVTATTTFIPEDYNGYANVTISFDGSALAERTELVVFETLSQEGREVARHHDLNDRRQTITVNPVSIATTARDQESGTHQGLPAEEVTIIDTVTYQGLVPGHEYRLIALLMNKDTGEPYTVDDRVVTVEQAFVPDASEGVADVAITIPGANLDGTTFVVFESLYYEDRELAVHADLEDKGQTVAYAYPDLPLPPTGGSTEPSRPGLAQTGDSLTWTITALAVGAVGAVAIAYAARRNRPK